jgi:acyl-CoA synthetase (AMP-forming)/AMP-acid ligase II
VPAPAPPRGANPFDSAGVQPDESEARYVVDDSGSSRRFEPGEALPDSRPYVYAGAQQADVAAIFYTSGTTGFPKGAMHAHENVLANIETAFRVVDMPRDIGSDLRTLVVVPLFHVTGCHSQTLPALRAGGAAVLDAAFDGRRMIETLKRERISSCTAGPAIYYHILSQPAFASADVAAVRWASYGGAPIAPALVRKIAEQFPNARVGRVDDTVPLPGATVDPQAVVAYARDHLADFTVPQFVAVRGEPLPRNPNGKVLKAPLRETGFGAPLF